MTKKSLVALGWLLIFSFGILILLGFVFSLSDTPPLWADVDLNSSIPSILLIGLFVFHPLGILILLKGSYHKNYPVEPVLEISDGLKEFVYRRDFALDQFTEQDRVSLMNHDFGKRFPFRLVLIFHFITFGLFGFFYFGLHHGRLPRIKDDDFGAGTAIGCMYIPIYSIYRRFEFWLRLADRLNLQYKLRNKPMPVSRGLVKVSQIFNLLPFFNIIAFLFLQPIYLVQMQFAINNLVSE